MSSRSMRVSAVALTLVASSIAAAGAASAVGPGTFTRITTPSGNLTYPLDGTPSATNNLTVSGQTSNDVTSVDIACIFLSHGAVNSQNIATTVPVTGGEFSTVVSLSVIPNCRLRALPTGVDPSTDYLGAYTGPILYENSFTPNTAASTTVGYDAIGGQGTGLALVTDAGTCGVELLVTITTPTMSLLGPGQETCVFALPWTNITSTGTSTASAIRVDSHNAYLPAAVDSFLNGTNSLGLAQTTLTTSITRHASGDVTVRESAPLVRCAPDDTYPPTGTSCTSLVGTGVTFARTVDIFRGAHQVKFRDSWASTDGLHHSVAAQYQANRVALDAGSTGYRFPGHGSSYATGGLDQVVTGLGSKAGTVLVRSDLHSFEGDDQTDTAAWTWSRAPSKVQFSHTDVNTLAMPYSISVPAAGKSYVGFAVSEAVTTSSASSLATLAVRDVMARPTITSPKAGAVIHGHRTTVKGAVSLGANGLPTSVTVNGHAAKLTKVSATRDTYAVSFNETFAKHKLTVTATDLAGNTASASRRVTNKP